MTTSTLLSTAAALVLALRDRVALPGFLAMLLASALVVSLELGLRGGAIMWGPFRFRRSDAASTTPERRSQLVRQIVGMWSLFFDIIPAGILALEVAAGWQRFGPTAWSLAVGGVAFALAGAFAVRSGLEMVRFGEGTPLPAACANRLVSDGSTTRAKSDGAHGAVQGLALGAAFGSWSVIAYALCGAIAWQYAVRPLKERFLLGEFGEQYAAYRAVVPCWRVRRRAFVN